MTRKRLTELFPFLLPLRQYQRNFCFYFKMNHDQNQYASQKRGNYFNTVLFEDRTLLINENSGMDIQYQYNKVHNLKLASSTIDGLIVYPGEVFSFWQCVRQAKRKGEYKEGLSLIDGKLVHVYGGGLCQISNLLYWCFLHSPMTVLERHTHFIKAFPDPPGPIPHGVDATVSEGWKDLKIKNETSKPIQIEIKVMQEYLYVALHSTEPLLTNYHIESRNRKIIHTKNQRIERIEVYRKSFDRITQKQNEELLYINECRIGYDERGTEK